jgi:isocitrate dehydrogenase kinase/phosphatase
LSNSFITQRLTKNWKGRLSARYSDVVGDFSLLNFDLTYDWHCREVIFSYDYVEETYKVQLNFKAFPQASLSTDMDPMELLYL